MWRMLQGTSRMAFGASRLCPRVPGRKTLSVLRVGCAHTHTRMGVEVILLCFAVVLTRLRKLLSESPCNIPRVLLQTRSSARALDRFPHARAKPSLARVNPLDERLQNTIGHHNSQ
jgi:hypothetical protein